MPLTAAVVCEHIQQSIERAERHQSYIDESVLHLGGFSTGVIRRLFSNLVHYPKEEPSYLECGLFKGATICAAMNNSPTLHVYGVENYSQPFGEKNVREELERNITAYRAGAKSVTIFDADCMTLDLSLLKHPIDVMYADQEHSFASQRDVLVHYGPALSDIAVVVIDDYSWITVQEGSKEGLRIIGEQFDIVRSWHLGCGKQNDPVWHNDVAIFTLVRK